MSAAKDRWSVGEAKQHLSEVLEASQSNPQIIENRGKPKSVLISFTEFKSFIEFKTQNSHRSVNDIIDSILALKDEGPEFPDIPRQDRLTPFDDPSFYEEEDGHNVVG